MATPQLNATLGDPKVPVQVDPVTTAAAAAEKSSSSALADPANTVPTDPLHAASIATAVSAKLVGTETPSTSSTPTRTTMNIPSNQPTSSERASATIHTDTDDHSVTVSRSTVPTGVLLAETKGQASSASASSSTSSSRIEAPSPTPDPPPPAESTTWESSSSTVEWTPSSSEPAPSSSSETWQPAESSSSSWTSDWTESSSSWTALVTSSTHIPSFVHTSSTTSSFVRTSSTPPPMFTPVTHEPVTHEPETLDPPVSAVTTDVLPSDSETPGPGVLKAGVLTTSAHAVSSIGLITSNNSTAEASTATDEPQVKKIAGMQVGWFAGMIVAIVVVLLAVCLIFAKLRKKKSKTASPRDSFSNDPNDIKRPMTEYDDGFAQRSPDRASSFFNSSSSSKYVTPVTLHQDNLVGRGNAWPAPSVPAPTSNDQSRASRYQPTSGRVSQPTSAYPSETPATESNEILAEHYPDSDYEQLDTREAATTAKRKTTATTRTGATGSVYSIDSMWGNASEAPQTARSSMISSFLPWRRSTASEAPAVPVIPVHMQSRAGANGGKHGAQMEPLPPPPQATRLPPTAAMAQTPVAVRQKPGFGEGGFVLPLGGLSR